MTSVSYDNGANAQPLSEWMEDNIFLHEKPVDTNIKITRKAGHVLVSPVARVKDLNDVKHKGLYQV